ncbi:MAG: LCP family protein [Oscillospiraceae bacterium]|nr:LCP family protein [Oscillospiraceae bacterium]
MKKTRNSGSRKRRVRGRKPYSKAVRGLVITAISLLSIMSLFFICIGVYALGKIGLVKFGPQGSGDFIDSLIPDYVSGVEEVSDYSSIEDGAASISEIPVRTNTKSVKNILLLGVDSRTGSYSSTLADAIMILTIDSKNKSIKLTSLMRDTLVTLPGRDRNGDGRDDYAKLNAAYAYGGFDLMYKTIEQNFRLRINQHITINFDAFRAAVNAMGGIDIELTAAEARAIKIANSGGKYHLNGNYALKYARLRKLAGDDFQRTSRQRTVIKALFEKAKKMSIGKLNTVLNEILPQVYTNMTRNEFTMFTINSLNYFGYSMDDTFRIPPDGQFSFKSVSGVGSVLLLNDPAKTITELHKFIYI